MQPEILKYLFDIHSYDNVDTVIIWGILKKDLPLLETEVSNLLNG